MKSFKNYINEGIITGRGGAADKRIMLYPKLMREWCDKYAKTSKLKFNFEGDKVVCIGDILITDEDIVELDFPFKIDVLRGDFIASDCTELHSVNSFPEKVEGSVVFEYCIKLREIKCVINYVSHDFSIIESALESLKGAPKEVGGDFSCECCDGLKSLEGAPKTVGGDFSCRGCDGLKSLEGAPKTINKKFNANRCLNLETLKGAPKTVGGDFICDICITLTDLKGAPTRVRGSFNCNSCPNLESLEGAPKYVGGNFNCYNCKRLKFLDDAPKTVGGDFRCDLCGQDFSEEDVRSICKVTGEVYT